MISRERIKSVFSGKEPDKIPVDFSSRSTSIEVEAYERLKKHLGITSETVLFLRDHVLLDPKIIELFQVDTAFVRSFPGNMYRTEANGDRVFKDEWGTDWRKKSDGIYYEWDNAVFADTPFEEMDWPNEIITEEQVLELESQAEYLNTFTDRAIFCDYVGPAMFERSWYLRGLDTFMIELLTEKYFVHRYLEKILELQLSAYEKIIDVMGSKLEGFFIIDDVAMQSGPLIAPDIYREMIKPYHKRLFDFIHKAGKIVIYHCCGSATNLIPDFIDAGIDALNPLQLSAENMDPVFLKKEYGKDIVFWGGGVNTQETLAFGTPEEVRSEVRRRMEILAVDGGYVFAAEHCIQPGTPVENILALFEGVNEF